MNQIMEDVNIAEFTRNSIYSNDGPPPTKAQERNAKALFASQLEIIKSKMGGTKDGSGTAISNDEKDALIRLLLHPETRCRIRADGGPGEFPGTSGIYPS